MHPWKQAGIQIQFSKQCLRPSALHDIQQQRTGRIADFRCEFPRQTIPHVVLGQQDLYCPVEILLLVVAQPQNLGRRKAGQSRIRDHPDQLLSSARQFFDLNTFCCSALIVPQQRRTNDTARLVQKHAAVHLSAQANSTNVCGLQLRRPHHLLYTLD